MKIAHPWPPFESKIPAVKSMCSTCPFHPSNEGYASYHPDLQAGGQILTMITAGAVFPCHQTAILDPRTKFAAGEPLPNQKHFRNCLGAVLYKRGLVHAPGTNPVEKASHA